MNTEEFKKKFEKMDELMTSFLDIQNETPIAVWDEEIDNAVMVFLTKEGYEEMEQSDWDIHPYDLDDDKVAMRMNLEEFEDLVVSLH